MEVSVIIVNYNVKYFLEQTLKSAEEALADIESEIIVIDNNSSDGSIEFLKSKFPDVRFIVNRENVGFSKANNIGIKLARGKYSLVLNPDTVIGKDVINGCIQWMDSHTDCGGIGVRMIDGNGVFLPESKRSFPSPWVSFCKMFGLTWLFPKSPLFAKYHLRYLDENAPHKIDILAGAYMFIRTALLQRTGGFDEDFFMYGEDIDLSFRMVEEGFFNYYIPQTIIHYKGESTKKDSIRYVKVFYEAMLIFFRKHYPNYSTLYSFFIKAAVFLKAFFAVLKRIMVAAFGFMFGRKKQSGLKWLVVSDNPQKIKDNLAGKGFDDISVEPLSGAVINTGNTDVVLDDSCMTYQQIIDFISLNSNPDLRFHIYSSANDMIISPKMQII